MIVFSEGALDDLERIFDFNAELDERLAVRRVEAIRTAIGILEQHPHIGRRSDVEGLRELVITSGKRGFVALYAWDERARVIRVLSIRHQLEAGYREV